jgi:mRNA deadenylase 3'-5' endonuclease subunit Ccr4
LDLIQYLSVHFNDLANIHEDKWRFLKDNTAIIAEFQIKQEIHKGEATNNNPTKFVVATTHFLWDPKYADVKFAQGEMLLEKLHQWVDGRGECLKKSNKR